jgi:predicted transcriptional regulator
MSTISIPLTSELEKQLDILVEETGGSRASVMRNALKRYQEDYLVQKILLASQEPSLSGDLNDLLIRIG